MPQSGLSGGATHHFQLTASSSPGSTLDVALKGWVDWAPNGPQRTMPNATRDSRRQDEHCMTLDLAHTGLGAKRKQRRRLPDKMICGIRPAGFLSPGCQGPWRFGKRTPPGLDRSNGSLSGLAADSLAVFFFAYNWSATASMRPEV